jgi:hypothetical protein
LNLKNILINPLHLSRKKLRSALSSVYYVPASITDSIILKNLETQK